MNHGCYVVPGSGRVLFVGFMVLISALGFISLFGTAINLPQSSTSTRDEATTQEDAAAKQRIYEAMRQAMPRAREAVESGGGSIDWDLDGHAVTVKVTSPVLLDKAQAREVGLLAGQPFAILPVGTTLIVEVRSPAGQLLDREWNLVTAKK